MSGANHFVAGALIAIIVPQPVAAISLAVVSHFVMDMLPHYGDPNARSWLRRHFNYMLTVDAALVVLISLGIIVAHPINWLLLIICGAIATLPDLVWLKYYLADLRMEPIEQGPFAQFSKWIQWGERPWGIYIELVWLAATTTLLFGALS